jgi:hypothetical protein
MHPLTESQRGEIIGLYKNKQSVPKISRVLKVHRATVTRTIAKYLNGDDLTELETALQEEWGKISMNQIISLIESMPRRIEAVITSNGWPTKY